MKMISIPQPHAALIVTPKSHLPRGERPAKVHNLTWRLDYRGPLAIHASTPMTPLSHDDQQRLPNLHTNAIIGVAQLADCVPFHNQELPQDLKRVYGWIEKDPHATGPYVLVLKKPQALERPFPIRGTKGFAPIPPTLANFLLELAATAERNGAVATR